MEDQYLNVIKRSLKGGLDTSFPVDLQAAFHKGEITFSDASKNSMIRTMGDDESLDNTRFCVEEIIKNDIPGDFLEAGCWRGGNVIYMKACLNAFNNKYNKQLNRSVLAADLFPNSPSYFDNHFKRIILKIFVKFQRILTYEMRSHLAHIILDRFPKEEPLSDFTIKMTLARANWCPWLKKIKLPSSSAGDLENAFKRYFLWDDTVQIHAGWFADSFKDIKTDRLAILRVDADFYQSTKLTLDTFYSKLSPGGICIIDDYSVFPEAKKAVDDFRLENNITATLCNIGSHNGIYWRV